MGGAEWVRGTHTGRSARDASHGQAREVRGVSIFEFASDKTRHCSDWHMATLLKQLGLMPSAESALWRPRPQTRVLGGYEWYRIGRTSPIQPRKKRGKP